MKQVECNRDTDMRVFCAIHKDWRSFLFVGSTYGEMKFILPEYSAKRADAIEALSLLDNFKIEKIQPAKIFQYPFDTYTSYKVTALERGFTFTSWRTSLQLAVCDVILEARG